jgi:twinkle protein
MISDESIEKVKEAIVIKDVIGDYVKLKKSGKDWEACCPFHNDRTPSFKVSPVKKRFTCFGCGKRGDAIAFVMEHENISYIPAIELLAKRYNIELEGYEKKEYVKPTARLEKMRPEFIEWFETKRGISNNTLLRFNITESVEWMHQFKAEVPVVCFNYYRNGELINIKFRGKEKSFRLSKDGELILYNLDAIKDEKTAIVVEGEIDCLTAHECGIYNVVSVPNGTPPDGKFRLEYMDNCYQYFIDKEVVILAVDNDEVGRKLRSELARRIGYEKCKQVVYPDGCKDINDVLIKYGKEAVKEVFNNLVDWPLEGLYTAEEWEPEVDEYYYHGYPAGLRTRIPGFDEYLTFYPAQLTVVTGAPQSGKSEFVDLIMTSLSLYEGITWGVCSFENPVPIHVSKLAEKYAQKAFDLRQNPNHRMSPAEFEAAKAKIKRNFHFINYTKIDITIDGLIAKATELVKTKGITGLLFDPWNCIEHKYKDSHLSETMYVLMCLNKIISFLDKYKVIGILIAHPKKLEKKKGANGVMKYPIPSLYDISGSAHFFNRTHNGFSVVRDLNTNQVDIYIQKVKLSWLGKLGYCSFWYDTFTRQYNFVPALSGDGNNSNQPVAPIATHSPAQSTPQQKSDPIQGDMWQPVDTEGF